MSDTLTPEERGLVAGLASLGAEKSAVDRLLAPSRVAGAWHRIRELPREQRVTALAELLRDLLAPVPADIDTLHPTWVADALSGEPPALAAALALEGLGEGTAVSPLPLDPEARAQLRRLVFAPLEPLTAAPAGPLGAALAALSEADLLFEVTRRGAQTLGVSLAGAPLEARARAMASAGAPWSSEIAAAADRHVPPTAREQARTLVARASRTPAPTPLHRLRAVGLASLAADLTTEGRSSLRHVAGRLPVELGRLLLAAGQV